MPVLTVGPRSTAEKESVPETIWIPWSSHATYRVPSPAIAAAVDDASDPLTDSSGSGASPALSFVHAPFANVAASTAPLPV